MTDPLAQLRAEFQARCADDLRELRDLTAADPEARRIVHRLAGAAGSFGYFQLGEIAARLDDRLRDGQLDDLEPLRHALVLTIRAGAPDRPN